MRRSIGPLTYVSCRTYQNTLNFGAALVAVCCVASTTLHAQQEPRIPPSAYVGIGAGLVDEGNGQNAFAFDIHGGVTAGHRGRAAFGVQGMWLSAFDYDCDAACNARARAVGVVARVILSTSRTQDVSGWQVGLGVGPFRTRYSKLVPPGSGLASETSRTVAGAAADVSYVGHAHRGIAPAISIRGLALPTHDGARADFVSLSVGAAIPRL